MPTARSMLTPALRNQDGTVLPMSGGAALTQLAKAVVLRNKLYGDRPRGTARTAPAAQPLPVIALCPRHRDLITAPTITSTTPGNAP